MKYFKTMQQDITIIRIEEKRATIEISKDFKQFLLDLIKNGEIKKLIVDFTKVDFVDSSFLGALVAGLKLITENKGDIKIFGLSASVRVMFELTRLYKVFEIHENEIDAIYSFNDKVMQAN